jgi:hypothetical protein
MTQYAIEKDEESDMYYVVAWERAEKGRTGSTLSRFSTYRQSVEFMIENRLVDVEMVD